MYLPAESLFMHTLHLASTPLRGLMTWLSGPAAPAMPVTFTAMPAAPARMAERRARPLRVLRVLDGPLERSAAGRMVISGRFADVCAELDRLAAAERR